jgi:hypothetical protein
MGYNVSFDPKFLKAKLNRARFDIPPELKYFGLPKLGGAVIFEPYKIWMRHDRRQLSDSVPRFLPGRSMEAAHDAACDAATTAHVFNGMLASFDLLQLDAEAFNAMVKNNQKVCNNCWFYSYGDAAYTTKLRCTHQITYTIPRVTLKAKG